MNDFYQQAREGVIGLARQNEQLIAGTAKQAATIRTLNERISQLEAEVNLQLYNVEFVKQQGRKTRIKLRNAKKAAKANRNRDAELAEANSTLRNAQATLRSQDIELRNAKLEIASLKASVSRLMDGKPLALEIVTEPTPFRVKKLAHYDRVTTGFGHRVAVMDMDTVEVRQCAIQLRVAPEHRRDLLMHSHVAKEAAARLVRGVEQQVLNALRGEEVDLNDVERKRHEQMMQMRQQQQVYGGPLRGGRADLIVADDIVSKAPSAEEAQGTAWYRPHHHLRD